jgi:serine/threonine protein kinase
VAMLVGALHMLVCMQLLSQVMRAVKALHGAGYAHGNIKPSNIIRRLKQHDWILTDLACAASFGAAFSDSHDV